MKFYSSRPAAGDHHVDGPKSVGHRQRGDLRVDDALVPRPLLRPMTYDETTQKDLLHISLRIFWLALLLLTFGMLALLLTLVWFLEG